MSVSRSMRTRAEEELVGRDFCIHTSDKEKMEIEKCGNNERMRGLQTSSDLLGTYIRC